MEKLPNAPAALVLQKELGDVQRLAESMFGCGISDQHSPIICSQMRETPDLPLKM